MNFTNVAVIDKIPDHLNDYSNILIGSANEPNVLHCTISLYSVYWYQAEVVFFFKFVLADNS